ncbi:MAG TPA: PepSY domain-containing protein [Methylophilaceae bacterium]|nr:PepSY domain-containing protein [Methylophilaceae bacterium]
MNTFPNTFKTIVIAAGVAALSSPAFADDDDVTEAKAIAAAAGLMTLEQATEKALQAKPGTVIEVELDKRTLPQGWDYEFEIVDAEGKEWDVNIDAKTGEARKVSQDWF